MDLLSKVRKSAKIDRQDVSNKGFNLIMVLVNKGLLFLKMFREAVIIADICLNTAILDTPFKHLLDIIRRGM